MKVKLLAELSVHNIPYEKPPDVLKPSQLISRLLGIMMLRTELELNECLGAKLNVRSVLLLTVKVSALKPTLLISPLVGMKVIPVST